MNRTRSWFAIAFFLALPAIALPQAPAVALTPLAASASTPVPPLVEYTGTALNETGKPLGGIVSVTFLIFKDETGGEPLWVETQNLSVDTTGHYAARLGATLPDGLPLDLFAGGAARWLEVQIAGQAPKARTLLISVPYALKAANADFLGGKSATDFVTADQLQAALGSRLAPAAAALNAASNSSPPPVAANSPAGSGTANYLPVWIDSATLGNSVLYQSGNKIGIGTTSPSADLQVNSVPGTSGVTGANGDPALTVIGGAGGSSTGTATAGGKGGAIVLTAGAGGNSTGIAGSNGANITLQSGAGGKGLTVGSYGNILLNPSGGFVGIGTATPQFPLQVLTPYPTVTQNSNNALNEFAVGTNSLSIASGITDSGYRVGIKLNNYTTDHNFLGTLNNQYGAWILVGDGLGSGAGTINNSYALYLDNLANGAAIIKRSYGLYQAESAAQNYFAGNVGIGTSTPGAKLEVNGTAKFDGLITFATGQTFPGAVSTTGTVNAGSYDLGGSLFDYSGGSGNAFLGFAGSGTPATGSSNTGVGTGSLANLTSGESNSALGFASLHYDASGSSNTAMGALALEFDQTGSNNNAFGGAALNGNVSGNYNNAFGGGALSSNSNGSGNTAIGEAAGPDSGSPSLEDSTAVGAYATVSESDALVLGQTLGGSPGAGYVNVGIGTATPASAMEISVNAPNALGPTLTLTNPGGTTSPDGNPAAEASIDFKTYLHASTAHSPTSRIEAIDDNYGNILSFFVKQYGSDSNPLLDQMDVTDQGVGINNAVQVIGPLGIYQNPPVVGDFGGSIQVDGNIYGSVKDFRIDDPADPANEYLLHSSVESSEMMNIYTGNVVTDKLGLATVKLPDWFQAENADFRYQLTVIGRFAQAIVSKEIQNNQFQIATNASFVKVSWQVTAIRQDAYAKAHPLVVEQQKPAAERGYYIHPELFGQPEEKQIRWAHNPDRMRRLKANREAASARSNSPGHTSELPASERPPVPVFHPPAAQNIALPAHNPTPGRASAVPAPPGSNIR